MKVQIEENNTVITHDPLPTIPGDEKLKVQLFQNIIGNAIKYRSQEFPKINISATKEKNQYLFSIKDNGIGMSPEHLERYSPYSNAFTHMKSMKELELDLQLHKKLCINKVDRSGQNQNWEKVQHSNSQFQK